MTENFEDAKKIKEMRGTNFMEKVKEINEIPQQKEKKESVLKEKSLEVLSTETESKDQKEELKQDPVNRGAIVIGVTDKGTLNLRVVGEMNKLEILGLLDYANTIGKELLAEMAGTATSTIPAIKDGIVAILHATKALLPKTDK